MIEGFEHRLQARQNPAVPVELPEWKSCRLQASFAPGDQSARLKPPQHCRLGDAQQTGHLVRGQASTLYFGELLPGFQSSGHCQRESVPARWFRTDRKIKRHAGQPCKGSQTLVPVLARRVKATGGPQKSAERARQTMSRTRRKQFRGVGAGKPRREASANPQTQATACRSNLPPSSETSFQLRVACSH